MRHVPCKHSMRVSLPRSPPPTSFSQSSLTNDFSGHNPRICSRAPTMSLAKLTCVCVFVCVCVCMCVLRLSACVNDVLQYDAICHSTCSALNQTCGTSTICLWLCRCHSVCPVNLCSCLSVFFSLEEAETEKDRHTSTQASVSASVCLCACFPLLIEPFGTNTKTKPGITLDQFAQVCFCLV
jgi:hypothetical protein